jgi:uncharacterized protein (TIGR01568 family)
VAVVDIAPRRRSVGNDDTESDAMAAEPIPPSPLLGRRRQGPPAARPPHLRLPLRLPKAAAGHTGASADADAADSPAAAVRHGRGREQARVRFPRSFSYGNKAPGARVAAAVRVRFPRLGGATVSELERFAVVRRARDPQREFGASMVAMIASKRMVGRPGELETLLACYLSLNADEHHDCIVKVFRQVWFELNNSVRPVATQLDRYARESLHHQACHVLAFTTRGASRHRQAAALHRRGLSGADVDADLHPLRTRDS